MKPVHVTATTSRLVTTEKKSRSIDDQLEVARYEVESARRSVLEQCEHAVATLEDFARRAREKLTRATAEIDGKRGWGEFNATKLPGEVLHEATWGLANATSDVELAQGYASRYAYARAVVATLEQVTADANRQGVAINVPGVV